MNTDVINDQVSEIRVLSWNINGLGDKMADPDLLAFIREYDIIFLTETMKSNDYTLVLPGYQFHHVSRTFKHKNASRVSAGIGIPVANKFEKHTRIDSIYDHLAWLTITYIFILCAIIDKQRCLSKPLYTCFVDFTKAFDYIDRSALYYKLLSRGIDGNFLNVIKSMFSKAECRVKWDACISEILKSEFGALQGGMLSPKLFTEFLQDISKSFDQGRASP